jgi:hypothetical protein
VRDELAQHAPKPRRPLERTLAVDEAQTHIAPCEWVPERILVRTAVEQRQAPAREAPARVPQLEAPAVAGERLLVRGVVEAAGAGRSLQQARGVVV